MVFLSYDLGHLVNPLKINTPVPDWDGLTSMVWKPSHLHWVAMLPLPNGVRYGETVVDMSYKGSTTPLLSIKMVLFVVYYNYNTQDLMLAVPLVPVLAGVLKRLTVQVMLENMHP